MDSPADLGWLSLLAPLTAIAAAIVTRRVVPSLLLGVVLGSVTIHGFGDGLFAVFGYVWAALTDGGHLWILAFALLLGGFMRVLASAQATAGGGAAGGITRFATTRRRGQLTAWGMGTIFFFDDYANTLFVGSSMGPIVDKLRISREKLAFIVDSTAAPVASLAPLSTWIAMEIGQIADQIDKLGIQGDAYVMFLETIPSRFYPMLMLAFVVMVAFTNRDFGPMAKAEARAASRPRSDAPPADPDAAPIASDGSSSWMTSAVPLVLVLLTVVMGIYWTGRAGAEAEGEPVTMRGILSFAESSKAMVVASGVGGVSAILIGAYTGGRSVKDGFAAWARGGLEMFEIIAILTFAWSLGGVCDDLGTARFLVSALGEGFNPGLLPMIVFLISALVSFATGTSWGTMMILFPLAVPLAHQFAPTDMALLLGTISSILAGSVFGDHCSPISDTTIMSAMASGCGQIEHVRTQLPYAVLVGTVSVGVGSLPVGLGLWSPSTGLLMGVGILYVFLRFVGRPPAEAAVVGSSPDGAP